MPRLQLLSKAQQDKFDSSPCLNSKQREAYFSLDCDTEDYIAWMRKPINKVGFLIQLAYFRGSGKFFPNVQFRARDISFACDLLEIDPGTIDFGDDSYNYNARKSHKEFILKYSGWKKFSDYQSRKLSKELQLHARQQKYPKHLFPIATQFLITHRIELPPYYILCDIISAAYNKIEDELFRIVEYSLLPSHKKVLDDLIWFGDKRSKHYKYSALSKIKQISHSTKLSNILDSLETFKLLKAFYDEFLVVYKILELSEQATSYYSTWVQKSKLFQLKQFTNRSKAYLYLLAHIKHQYFIRCDLYVDIVLKSVKTAVNGAKKKEEEFKSSLLKQQKKALKKLASSHEDSKSVFNDILCIFSKTTIDSDQKVHQAKALIVSHLEDDKTIESDNLDVMKLLIHDDVLRTHKIKIMRGIASSLQRKLTPILCVLDFEYGSLGKNIGLAIEAFADTGGKIQSAQPTSFLTTHEHELVYANNKTNALVYKAILFTKIADGILSGSINLNSSYRYLSMRKYLIGDEHWGQYKDSIIESCDLSKFSDPQSTIDILGEVLSEKLEQVNEDYNSKSNKYLRIPKSGRFIVSTPKVSEKDKNMLSPIFCKEGIIPIPNILENIDNITRFSKKLKHHAIKKVIMKPSPKLIHAGILSKGCNHGIIRMANISKGITQDKLKNTVNWFFSLENLQAANNSIVEYINNLSLPNVYKLNSYGSITSSDGQKFNVGVDSILANYSFKYFGKEQGISVYSFIDDKQILFYDTVISPGEREAAYVIDGLMANDVIKSHIHTTDTHGYNEVIFATTHLLGTSFAPRIKRIGHQRLYCIEPRRKYNNKKYKIKPDARINVNLIKSHWDDILRFIATIRTKTTTASQIFKRLNSYTKEHPLYKALKEFGRLIKTIFILTYVDNLTLRQQIEKQLNKIELSNKFSKAVLFANGQELRVGSTEGQKIIVACKSLIQNCIVLWNYLYLSQTLLDKGDHNERNKLLRIIKNNSVLAWRHVNLHGEYDFTAANDNVRKWEFDLGRISRLKVA